MDSEGEPAPCLLVGMFIVSGAAVGLSPMGERTMVVELRVDGDPPEGADTTAYSSLSPSAQTVVDEVV